MLLAIIHWILSYGVSISLAILSFAAICYGVFLFWRPWQNRRFVMFGYNSIADQFRVSQDTTIDLKAPEPPESWTVKQKFLFRNGQLKALKLLEYHNQKVEADLKRGAKRATHALKKTR